MKKIGTADIIWKEFDNFIKTEKEHSMKREPGWYVSVRWSVSREIQDVLWSMYTKTGEGEDADGCGCPLGEISGFKMDSIRQHQDYLDSMGLSWDLLYRSAGIAVLQSGSLMIGLPDSIVSCKEYADLDTCPELMGKYPLVSKNAASRKEVASGIRNKQKEIDGKKKELEELEKEKQAELEKLKQELEAKYAEKTQLIREKKKEMEEQMVQLNNQMFVLDTELYGIRCMMGETVQFVHLVKGMEAEEKTPVVFFQKIRFLDEELGKWLAVYDFDGKDIATFEDALKNREDIRERFAPGPKSVSVIRISKNNILCGASDMVSNVLDIYKKFHGNQIGILIRNGENLYVGWTDEEKVRIKDENVYLKPETREDSLEEAEAQSREEVASRYFVFSILQGVLNDGRILKVPEKINVLTPSPYLIFSMADGWLEDNRYGTFADIVERTDAPLMKGDMILTTLKIERDDAGLGNIWNNGRSTRYDAWNNDRGRGERNRTHDAHIPDRRVVPVNLVDTIDTYTITEKKFRLIVTEVPVKVVREGNTTTTQFRYDTVKTNEYLGKTTSYLTVKNNKLYEKIDVKGKSPEQILAAAKTYGYVYTDAEQITMDHAHSYYTVFESIVHTETEKEYYVSAKKDNYWKDADSFANMEIRSGEYLNLTFLNSVYLVYAIQNHKIGGWRRGRMIVDYANSIPYLNKALEYIRKREKEEAVMLGRYMELYEGWQVDVSEWRLKNNYHRLTDARAGKFAKEKAGKTPAQKEKKYI